MNLIGLTGYAKSGKDTAAQAMIERGWKRVAFADELKRELLDLPPFLNVDITDNATKEIMRPLMVEYGRTVRKLKAKYWINQVSAALDYDLEEYENVIITDVRYVDEADWIVERGGMLVYIWRPGVGPANSEETNSIHEVMQKRNMVLIGNKAGIPELHQQLIAAWERFSKERK